MSSEHLDHQETSPGRSNEQQISAEMLNNEQISDETSNDQESSRETSNCEQQSFNSCNILTSSSYGLNGSLTSSHSSNQRCISLKGIVCKYLHRRKFGFIKNVSTSKNQDNKKEFFFHSTEILKNQFKPSVKEGDKCTFELCEGPKGVMAHKIIIYYRPIPKLKKQEHQTDSDNHKRKLQMNLFTNTILKLFEESTCTSK